MPVFEFDIKYTKYFLLFALLSLNVMFVGSSVLLHVLGVHLFSLLDSIRLYEYTTNISLLLVNGHLGHYG